MEPDLRFCLFGPFEVWRGGELVPAGVWRTRKHVALLKILIGERGRVVPGDRLIEWLWPDLPPEAGQANLYVGISLLRRVLEPERRAPATSQFIATHHPGYRFDASSTCWIDVDAFEIGISRAQAHLRLGNTAQAVQAYEAAAALYHGDYLADDPYEDWAIGPRERLREEYLNLLSQLHRLRLAGGEGTAALSWAQRALALDPCREEAHCQVMRACYALGRRAEALRQFERCRAILKQELDVEPMPTTLLLHQQILSGQVGMAAKPAPSEPRLGRLPFVGREAELAALREVLDRVRRGGCQVALVCGEAGVGKTRLVEEFAADWAARGGALRRAACHALDRELPYQPLREALTDALVAADIAALLQSLGPWAGVVAGMLPALWASCPDLEPPPALPPAEERARLLHGLARLVQYLAREEILVLFLDDLHWADGATLQALHYLSTHLGGSPVLLLAAYRTDEADTAGQAATMPLGQLLEGLRRECQPVELPLRRLSQAEVTALITVLARSPHGGKLFSQRLYRETGGNPFFLVETLRALFDQGVLYRDEQGAWATDVDEVTEAYEELPIPDTVREVVLRRCDHLPELPRQALMAAAAIGRAFQFELWLRVSGIPEVELVDALERCLARQLLVRRPDGRYEFGHALIREVIYDTLLQERRRLLHRRLADALVEQGEGGLAGEVAHHYLEAELWAPALEYLERAGDAALRLFAYEEAWPFFTRAYEVLGRLGMDAPRRHYAIVRQLYHLCSVMGRRAEAGRYMHEALALARALDEPGSIGETLQALCRHHFVSGEVDRALALSQEAVDLSRRAGEAAQEANALRQHGYLCYRSGQHDEAFTALEEALELSRQVGDRQIEAQNLNVLGVVRYYQGEYARALDFWQEALELCRQIGFKPVLAQVAGNLGEVYRAMGCYPEALAYRQEGLEVARAIGFRTIQPDGLLDMGLALSELGRHQEAIPLIEEALALAQEVGHRPFVAQALNGLARVRLRVENENQACQALALADEALDLAREIDLRHDEMVALSLRGQALLNLGQAGAACDASRAAVDLLQAHRIAEGNEPEVYYHHAQNLAACGEAAEAKACLARARAALGAKADRIADADLRRSFLRNVAIHRKIGDSR